MTQNLFPQADNMTVGNNQNQTPFLNYLEGTDSDDDRACYYVGKIVSVEHTGEAVRVTLEIVGSSNPAVAVGSQGVVQWTTHTGPVWQREQGVAKVKTFAYAACGIDPDNPEAVAQVPISGVEMTNMTSAAQPLTGQVIALRAYRRRKIKTEGKPWGVMTHYDVKPGHWEPWWQLVHK